MTPLEFDRIHGGAPAGSGLIDFSVSLNPLGPPPQVIAAYHQAAAGLGTYPDPYAATLAAALAKRLGLAPSMVLAGAGSTQLLYLIARVLRPARPVVVIPTFSEIANGLIAAGTAPQELILPAANGFAFDQEAFEIALLEGADALFAGRPNSPTGTLLTAHQCMEIAAGCAAHDCWCVFDEAFIEFAEDSWSTVALIQSHPRVIVTRSLTKLYAVPGLRLGYAVAQPAVIAELSRGLEPWAVSAPALAAGLACLELPAQWHARTRETVAAEREYLATSLAALQGIELIPSRANFLMLRVDEEPTRKLGDYLRENGLSIRDLTTMAGAGPGWYRIGIRRHGDNQRLVEVVQTYFR
jgi:threonine-phosphate decarboxylase